jgi:DNA end-binding protein Ku
MWTGVLSFGLVTLPLGLFTARDDHTVHFHRLQRGTGDRIRNKRVNERTGREVKGENIVKGYEVGDGQYVVVEPEELDDISPSRSKVVDISGFVDLADIEPVHFARTYCLAPRGKEYFKVYELLRSALHRSRQRAATRVPAGSRTWPRSARRISTPVPPTSASPAGPR